MKSLSTNSRAMLLSLLGFSLFSFGDVLIKVLADSGYKPIEVAFFLCFFNLPLLIIFSPILGGIKATLRTENLWLHVLRAILGMATYLIIINSFHLLGLSLSYTLLFTSPFIVALLSACFLKQKILMHSWIAIIFGFIGVLVVLRPFSQTLELATISILFASFLIAIIHMLAKKIGGDEPLMAFSLFGCIIGFQIYGVLNFWNGEIQVPQHSDWVIFFITACFHMGAGLAISRAFSIGDPVNVAPFQYIQLLWGTLFGITLFSTIPDIWTGVGALIIIISGIYLLRQERLHKIVVVPNRNKTCLNNKEVT